MCSWLPIRGSVFHFTGTWVDGALGFAAGYIYWYGAVMFVCVEFTAVASVIQFWNTSVNPAAWIAIGLGLSLLLNTFAVRYYGESEFVSSSLKIFLILGLMLLTIITMLGGNPKGDRYGFRNYRDPGPMKEYLEHGALGRFLGFWSVLIYAAFACGGPGKWTMK
jgi:amino acid transporter